MRTFARLTALPATIAVCGFLGCGSDDQPREARASNHPPLSETVEITASGYRPAIARIAVGGSVTWINRDPHSDHTAETEPGAYDELPSGETGGFDTHVLTWREPYTVTFHTPGTFEYHSSFDTLDPAFEGRVEVVVRQPGQRRR